MDELTQQNNIQTPNPIKNENKKHKGLLTTKDISQIALFASLMAIFSWLSIPSAVPFTLQTFGVYLALLVLGGFKGTLSILAYILLGAIGLPVFANFNGGFAYILGPTGGYIIGFLFTGLLMWALEKFTKKNNIILIITMIIGLILCYICGTVWFRVVYLSQGNDASIYKILSLCVFPFIIPDLLKIFGALYIRKKIQKVIK